MGYYTLIGGSLIAGNEIFGVSGMGQMDQSGGSHSVAGTLQMGAQGAYDLRGGTLKGGTISSGAGWLAIEGGTLIVTAGSVNVDKFYIGDTTDGAFTLPSGLTVTSNTLTVGQSGYGSLTQTGGSNHAQTLTLAAASNVAGTDTLSGGVLDVGTITSGVGTSTLNVDGGTLNITGGRVNVNAFNVGSAAGAAGSFVLTAGLWPRQPTTRLWATAASHSQAAATPSRKCCSWAAVQRAAARWPSDEWPLRAAAPAPSVSTAERWPSAAV